MARITYVNGRYELHAEAMIHVEDRGVQFADAVYEVLPVVDGRICHRDQHLDRLERSLAALAIAWPVSRAVLPIIMARVVTTNRVRNGVVYIQISRGVAHRGHLFPANTAPGLVVSAWSQPTMAKAVVEKGVAMVSRPDQRWKRPDIKTVGLLANLLARQSAKEDAAQEAILVDDRGVVTEASSSNFFIVAKDGALLTHPADGHILAGVTRGNVITLAHKLGLEVGERPFTLTESLAAREAFLTGTTITVLPVVTIDGQRVGTGKPGPLTLQLRSLYQELRRS